MHRLEYALKCVCYSRIILPKSAFGTSRWCSIYSLIISSVIFHVVQYQYHTAQKCFHRYLFFNSGNSFWIYLDVFHFSLFAISDIDNFGGYSICICTWSFDTAHFNILKSFASAICIINCLTLFWISHFSTLYLYFVTHTKCTVALHIVCPHVLIQYDIYFNLITKLF